MGKLESSSLLSGAIAGFVATLPMSVVMKGIQLLLPRYERYALPPSVITFQAAEKTGQPPANSKQHVIRTILAHFGVGTGFGLLYGLISTVFGKPRGGSLRSVIFGLLVWAVSYLGIIPALNLYNSPDREPARRHAMMISAHLIWGITTGQVYRQLAPVLKKRLV